MPRAAIVDIGTNSTRLLVAAIDDGKVTDELERRSTVTRLGAGSTPMGGCATTRCSACTTRSTSTAS